jgi:CheY-like chemotaxis protein
MEPKAKEDDKQKRSDVGLLVAKIRKNIVYYCLASVFLVLLAIIYIFVGYTTFAYILLIITILYNVILAILLVNALKYTQNSIDDLVTTNNKKEKLITYFSHKIREPLNNMLIINNILKESEFAKKNIELLSNLDTSTSSMIDAVDDLSMQSAGNFVLEKRKNIRYNLISTIQSAIDLYSQNPKKNIVIKLDKSNASNSNFIGDPVIVKQIFLDIITKIDSQYDENVTLSINHELKALSGSKYQISLIIKSDKPIPLIDSNDTLDSLSPKLISIAKGTYKQELHPDSTLLSVFIPTSLATEWKKPITSQKMEELMLKEKAKKELKDIKILLAEDNIINREITLMTLKPLVKRIDSAANGKEALELFGTSDYDVVLMDVQMPVMDGLTASMKIRELEESTNTHVPIIAITANAMLGDKEKCLAAGIDEYISKPFHPTVLIDLIKKLI